MINYSLLNITDKWIIAYYQRLIKYFHSEMSNYKLDAVIQELIKFLDNAAKYNSTGISLGFRTKLFKKINANLNSGLDYNVFEDSSPIAIIKKNSGYTFKGNLSLSTKLFKDKVAISFSGRQNGPEYSLLSKKVTSRPSRSIR